MRIHKEGTWVIPIAAMFIAALYVLFFWLIPLLIIQIVLALAALVFFGLIVYFFRHPNIVCPAEEGMIYAPADGKVVVIERVQEDEILHEACRQVSIFMSPLNVHVNRMPIAGTIAEYIYHKGKYLVAWHPKSSAENERTTIGFITSNGVHILMRQIAGAVARRICFYPSLGAKMASGEEIGFIRFGSRVDVFLPLAAEMLVRIGEHTKGGRTPIARLQTAD